MSECHRCGEDKETVTHHIQYDPEETVQLCHSCHGLIHHDEDSPYYPKDTPPKTSVQVSEETKGVLDEIRVENESYNDVVRRLSNPDAPDTWAEDSLREIIQEELERIRV